MISRYHVLCALSGAVWALLAWILGHQSMPSILWGGLLASPLIGVIIGWVGRRWGDLSTIGRVALALFTLYLAVTLFGVCVGLFDLTRDIPGRDAWEVVLQAVLATLWGVTFTGFVLFLWPLSFLNHWALARHARVRAS